MIRFGTLQGGQLLLMCHKFFSGDNLILSHTVMIIIDSKKQKIRQLHINEAGGKIKGFFTRPNARILKFYTTRHVSNSRSFSPVTHPDLQIREEGPVIQTLSERGGGGVPVSKKRFFRASVWSKTKGGVPSLDLPLLSPYKATNNCW